MKITRISIILMTALLLFTLAAPFTAAEAEAAGPNPVVIMETSMGRVIVQLYPDKTPITVKNFLRYVDEGYYNGTIFHRVINQGTVDEPSKGMTMVQGGGFTAPMLLKRPDWSPIVNEDVKGFDNDRGTIAMARTGNPHSATSQFFFNVEDNPFLNATKQMDHTGQYVAKKHGYCAFGKVLRGMDVLEKIADVKTGKRGRYSDVPLKTVLIKKVYRAQ